MKNDRQTARKHLSRAYATLRRTSYRYLRAREANFAASKSYQAAYNTWYALEHPEEEDHR